MSKSENKTDVILIGAGVMSATMGTLLKELVPDWKITVFEKLESAGEESSNEWNNAGTGHAALCELNYTAEQPDGSIDISKAIKINEQFQVSMQFWSYLVNSKLIDNPQDFIKPLPHMSMVQGEQDVRFLKKRFEALSNNPLFQGMEFSDDPRKLMEWIPLIMQDRPWNEAIAATKVDSGTDVNFGALTRMLFDHSAALTHHEARRCRSGSAQGRTPGDWRRCPCSRTDDSRLSQSSIGRADPSWRRSAAHKRKRMTPTATDSRCLAQYFWLGAQSLALLEAQGRRQCRSPMRTRRTISAPWVFSILPSPNARIDSLQVCRGSGRHPAPQNWASRPPPAIRKTTIAVL